MDADVSSRCRENDAGCRPDGCDLGVESFIGKNRIVH